MVLNLIKQMIYQMAMLICWPAFLKYLNSYQTDCEEMFLQISLKNYDLQSAQVLWHNTGRIIGTKFYTDINGYQWMNFTFHFSGNPCYAVEFLLVLSFLHSCFPLFFYPSLKFNLLLPSTSCYHTLYLQIISMLAVSFYACFPAVIRIQFKAVLCRRKPYRGFSSGLLLPRCKNISNILIQLVEMELSIL